MSSSKFRLIEDDVDAPLTLFVRPDGSITPDKETVKQILSNCSKMDINLMTMKKAEAGQVNIMMDSLTYISKGDVEDSVEMSELARNLCNFRMDHDYTPFTSPSQVPSGVDMVDELAQTLSMLEDGSLDPQLTNEPLTKITKIVNGRKQTIFVNSKEKQRMINAGLLKEKPTEKVFKKPKPLQAVPAQPAVTVIKNVEVELVPKQDPPSKEVVDVPVTSVPVEKVVAVPVVPAPVEPSQNTAITEKKVLSPNKKDKKLKQILIPDDMALFSTPDIIRRVGKDPEKTADTSAGTQPAKISPDSRSKSNAEKKRHSMDETPAVRRMSLDNRKIETPAAITILPPLKEVPKPVEQRKEDQVSVQDFGETMSNSSESVDNQLEPIPSAEDIRAMIHSEGTKSFTINSVLTEPPPPEHSDDPQEDVTDGTSMTIDAACLDLNQSILENISTDLSEDILYKVAQSLVDNNTELQNLIDKSLTDGNLDVIASPASHLQATDTLDSLHVSAECEPGSSQSLSGALPQSDVQTTAQAPVASGATQIIRPGGRIVVIPPIERPTTRSRNKKPPSATTPPAPKPVIKPLDDQHVSGEELDSSGNDEDDEEDGESDDDPNKLWCICNQPHNNRFMICCDTCEEWYHGKCVNVTKAMGQTMEQQGKDWMCVYCRDPTLKRPAAAMRRIRKASRTSTDSASTVKSKQSNTSKASSTTKSRPGMGGINKNKPTKDATPTREKPKETETKPVEKKQSCVVCGKPSRSSSIYCSDNCILKHAQGVEKVAVTKSKSGPAENKESDSNLDKWLADTSAQEAVSTPNKLVKVMKPGSAQLTQSKLKIVKNVGSQGVSLAVQKKGVSVGILPHSPKPATNNKPPVILNATLKNKHGTSTVTGLKIVSKQATLQLQRSGDDSKTKLASSSSSPLNKSASSSGTPLKLLNKTPVKAPVKKESPLPQKAPKPRVADGNNPHRMDNLRDNVRKTFFEQLSNRLKNVDDLKLSDDELKEVSDEIESQLYRCFADTGQKYRNKYRSLIFNIKDPKNQTLWRRICEKSVNPYQLVRLSPDDLASQELALWRERETKHQLDMIKKSELELLNCSRQYVFKTHKGETVFEDDRAKDQVEDVVVPGADGSIPDADDIVDDDKKQRRDKDGKSGREKDSKRRSKSKDRKKRSRSRDRDRTRHSDRDRERRRSRSRDRHRDRDRERRHKSSRHRKDEDKKDKPIITEKLDKKSKEILEQLVDKQIVPPLEDKLWKTEEVMQATDSVVPTSMPESDSDHEPSSTVTIPTPPRVPEQEDSAKKVDSNNSEKTMDKTMSPRIPEEPKGQEALWSGLINMIDVAHIAIHAYEVTGDCAGLGDELPSSGHLDIVGRIAPETVWDYIDKMKSTNGKSISVLRLTPTTMDERKAYLSLYSYLSSRQRLGVVKCENKRVKDFYILPLASNSSIPKAIAPITGPGFGDSRPSLLVGIIVRDKRKRALDSTPSAHTAVKRVRVEVVPGRTPGTPPPPATTSRSYTPPPSLPRSDPRVKLPVPSVDVPEENEEDMDEPYSPADSDPDSMQEPPKKLESTDLSSLIGGAKSTSFLDSGISHITNAAFEPFSNKFDGIPGLGGTPSLPSNSLELEQKMAELDQKIAAQKAEIDKVSKDLVCSSSTSDLESNSLANIALPSNLQQILESIKSIGTKGETPEYQPETPGLSLSSSSTDLTIPLILPKLNSRTIASNSPSSDSQNSLPFPPAPPANLKPEETKPSGGGVLSSLSEEDLIKKAAEMLGEVEPPSLKRRRSPPPTHVNSKKGRLEMSQPPIPGLED